MFGRIESAPYVGNAGRLALAAPRSGMPILLASGREVGGHGTRGRLDRYTIAAVQPIATVSANANERAVRVATRVSDREFSGFSAAARFALGHLKREAAARDPFSGGLAGLLTYERAVTFEQARVTDREFEERSTPELWFGLYASAYIADHETGKGWFARRALTPSFGALEKEVDESYVALESWIARASRGDSSQELEIGASETGGKDWRIDWKASVDAGTYRSAVERIRELLRAGDAYQVNLTVRHRREASADPASIFASLAARNPAALSAFIRGGDWAILSASPELLLDVAADGWIETRPIKGTIEGQGEIARSELLASEKDRAEHLMIVDLERNDLGRVCVPGSIRVDPLMSPEGAPGMLHMVSRVRGRLREGVDSIDALRAMLPGGSVTGAPKIRAMQIIRELEPVARGVYCGALGWITPEGTTRFNLPIRTMTWSRGILDLHVGGGIVVDSDPESEYEECRIKGARLAQAVELAEQAARSEADNEPVRTGAR